MRNQILCAAVLSGVLGLLMLGGTHREAPLVGYQKLTVAAPLEASVALHPEDAAALTELCQMYLERGSPGLAIAAIERAPKTVRQSPRVAHLWAVALMHEGHASVALAKEQGAIAACDGRQTCGPWLLASAMRHEEFLRELVQHGIEDYKRDPDGTVAAYGRLQRSTVAVLDPAVFGLAAAR